ncbi:hypothetical protein INT43_004028 [Umbelopsis isabellina]|uniref:HTH APSES-type domain-containing protein n=1 Tax=Mortierella isabellina TaxID=91625 RepID=A0A8H7PTF5_MORIS|nr:hypothetical protein INT43_004028 [Umbelopsis isabellina]
MSNNIYSAVYSGVPVYEMMCRGIAVMRRRADSYMNATQILKVAGIDKGKRTKILEREVLIGEHEKVQGGYGKYQGTWIPFDKSRELAERYQVADLLAPMFDYDGQQGVNGTNEPLLTKEQHVAEERKKAQLASPMAPSPLAVPARSQTAFRRQSKDSIPKITKQNIEPKAQMADRPRREPSSVPIARIQRGQTADPQDRSGERHRNVLMAIFLNEDPTHIPELLMSQETPHDFNTELVIDDQGHAALHWASALARIKIVELLLNRGANVMRTNFAGETALMRACMVVNNYEQRSFERMLGLLEKSVPIADKSDKTILHHIALTSAIDGRQEAASYYLKCMLKLIRDRKELQGLLDVQDENGDTALNIAARGGSKELMEQLIAAGASDEMVNHNGIKPEDYNELDNNVTRDGSPQDNHETLFSSNRDTPGRSSSPINMNSVREMRTPDIIAEPSLTNYRPSSVPSKRGREIVSAVQKIVDELDSEFSEELESKQQEIDQIQQSLESTATELKESRAQLQQYKLERQRLAEAERKSTNLTEAVEVEKAKLADKLTSDHMDINIDMVVNNAVNDKVINQDPKGKAKPHEDMSKIQKLESSIVRLRAKITIYKKNELGLMAELAELETQSSDKEDQCKKLIAACCGVPIEKVDSLLHPLIQAIESDPPDLDLSRVAGFMAKIQSHDDRGESSSKAAAASIDSAMDESD